MESNNFQGDLADIFRPGGDLDPPAGVLSSDHWEYNNNNNNVVFDHEEEAEEDAHIIKSTRSLMRHDDDDDDDFHFGQPFASLLADPLINIHHQELASTPPPAIPCFFGYENHHHHRQQQQQSSPSSSASVAAATRRILLPLAPPPLLAAAAGFKPASDHNHNQHNNNNNMFSKMLQISPASNINAKSTSATTNNSSTSDHEVVVITSSSTSNSSKRSLLETSTTTLQISSPRNPAIKRRKSQAKKVVCIPAPTPANSRPTGEVVPSDLWAWRKYGQKPIKGSPFPRGYYRCSSSKGCSARKQVERSRTEPNMLVITYTSEHNHPWPTQRNALAGSTRTPQSTPKTVAEQPPQQHQQKEINTEDDDDDDQLGSTLKGGTEVVQVKDELQALSFPQGYRPELPNEHGRGGQPEDFFSGLGEIEIDPITMLLNQGFLVGDEEEETYNKDLDPFG